MNAVELEFDFQRALGGRKLSAAGILNFGADAPILAIMGPSGIGKTSWARWIAGLDAGPGELRFNSEWWCWGRQSTELAARRVGYLPQQDALFPHLNVRANIAFGLRQLSAAERSQRVDEMLQMIGLPTIADRRVTSLSGGERRRVALAQMIVAEPRLLILDEPWTGLDDHTKFQFLPLIKQWLLRARIPTLLITHDTREARELAARTYLLNEKGFFAQPPQTGGSKAIDVSL